MTERKDWFESWFNSPYYEVLYQHRDDTEAKMFIDNLLKHLQPDQQSVMLDLACGTGRHAVYLAEKGFDVTGLDLSEEHIKKAKQYEQDRLTFYTQDMRNEFRTNYYHYIFNFFTSFGYFHREHDNIRALSNVYKGLKPNGIFVIDFLNAEKVKQNLDPEDEKFLNDIRFTISRSFYEGWITKLIEVDDKGKHLEFHEKVRALTLLHFKRYFDEVGLKVLKVFGNYHLDPFDPVTSDRLIITAQKPA